MKKLSREMKIWPIILLLLFLGACAKMEEKPNSTQLLRNNDLSDTANNVLPWVAVNTPGFELGISDSIYRSGKQSIFIRNKDSTNQNIATWTQIYSGSIPRSTQRLRLMAHLKGENLNLTRLESGVYISIRVFPVVENESRLLFASTQNFSRFQGTFDWQPLEVILPHLPDNIENIRVYMNMGAGTTGTIYFDDISLFAE